MSPLHPAAGRPYDVIIATDFRFHGGSAESTLAEIDAQHSAGLNTGIFHLPSPVVKEPLPFHPGVAQALAAGHCELLNFAPPARCKLLLFRHPTVLTDPDIALPAIDADAVALIVNQPPVDAFRSVDYDLPIATARLSAVYAAAPKIFPIGPLIRTQLAELYGDRLGVEARDWVNIVDLQRFATPRAGPRDPIRIGRHSLHGEEKWPDTAAAILGAYPERDGIEVRILGGTAVPEKILRRRPKNWTVYAYGTRTPETFLREIDVFVYFHHPRWVEAFGRTILEAAASGTPLILSSGFKALLGDAAIYCAPSEAESWLEKLRDPETYRYWSKKALAFAKRFSPGIHLRRLADLGIRPAANGAAASDAGFASRAAASAKAWRLDEKWSCGFIVLDDSTAARDCIQTLQPWTSLIFAQAQPYLVLPKHAADGFGGETASCRFEESDDEVVKAFAGVTTKAIRTGDRYVLLYVLRDSGQPGFGPEQVQADLLRAYAASASRPRDAEAP
jgi:hypothetical protein